MKKERFNSKYSHNHVVRFNQTLKFMEGLVTSGDKILDIGPPNPMGSFLIENGFNVQNTPDNIDLDLEYGFIKNTNAEAVTAFEILEHLVSPFPLLQAIEAPKLFASVPLSLWFAKAYWNYNDPFDRHYHEFEPRQFDMLLEKAGWIIKKTEKWVSPTNTIGIRPLLRKFTPRYYIVYCERK